MNKPTESEPQKLALLLPIIMVRIKNVKTKQSLNHEASQEKQELEWFNLFQNKTPDCPRGQPVQSRPPKSDIIFQTERLGIELTEYMLGQDENGSPAYKLENARKTIVEQAQQIHETMSTDVLQISVGWDNNLCPPKTEWSTLAQALSRAVGKRIPWLDVQQIEKSDFPDSSLRTYVGVVSVYKIPGGTKSCWSTPIALCFGTVASTISSIQQLIDKKTRKIAGYRASCDTVWLLIVCDPSSFASDLGDTRTLKEATYASEFDRVFVLNPRREEVFELQVTKSCNPPIGNPDR